MLCSKRCPSKSIKPIPTHSTGSTISLDRESPPISPIPVIKNPVPQKKFLKHYNANHTTDEYSYLNNNKNKSQQQESMNDNYNETTATINESHMYTNQRQKKRFSQPVKPMADIRVFERQTPYPPDVIARERLMNHNRFSTDDKY